MLRTVDDFSNRLHVEFATVQVVIPNSYLPSNLYDHYFGYDDDSLITLGVSSKGNLTRDDRVLYLDSVELAEDFISHLHDVFSSRSYRDVYELKLVVSLSTKLKTVARWKVRDSAIVRAALS